MNNLRMVVLSLTGQCNFACRYCYASEAKLTDMDFKTAIGAIKLGAKSGRAFVLQLSGGEPLLSLPLIKKIAKYIEDKKIPAIMQVQTNGSLLNQENAFFLKKAKIGVGVSVDGRPRVHDEARCWPNGKGTCLEVLTGIGQLGSLGIQIGVTTVVTAHNVEQLAGIVEMAYYMGNIRRIGFDLLRLQGRGTKILPATAEAVSNGIKTALDNANSLAEKTGQIIIFSQLEHVKKQAKGERGGFCHCHAITGEAIFVDAEGYIYPCPSLAGEKWCLLGHVDEGLDYDKQQKIAKRCRQAMEFCQACEHFNLCGGGCFARWYLIGKDTAYLTECALKKAFIEYWKTENNSFV